MENHKGWDQIAIVVVLAFVLAVLSGCGTSNSSSTVASAVSGLAVADGLNNRVLIYPTPVKTDESATIVLGQRDLTHEESFNWVAGPLANMPLANTLNIPSAIAKDAAGNLYVADSGACRVLQYQPPFTSGMNASLVIGQSGFNSLLNCPGDPFVAIVPVATATSLGPLGSVAIDSAGNLWVTDEWNHRVLEYVPPFSNGMAATLAIGQTSTAAGVLCYEQTPSASTLCSPTALSFDSKGNLWVSDHSFHRILEFVPPFSTGMAASLELGQPPATAFTSVLSQTPSANSLDGPMGLTFDSNGNLWVADQSNNRVLEFIQPFTNGMAASIVVGQPNFLQVEINQNQHYPAANTLNSPFGVAFDAGGDLLVSDTQNNRVLVFAPPLHNGMSASSVVGQSNFSGNDDNQGRNSPDANTLSRPGPALMF